MHCALISTTCAAATPRQPLNPMLGIDGPASRFDSDTDTVHRFPPSSSNAGTMPSRRDQKTPQLSSSEPPHVNSSTIEHNPTNGSGQGDYTSNPQRVQDQVSRAYPTVLAGSEGLGFGSGSNDDHHGFQSFARIPPPTNVGYLPRQKPWSDRVPHDLAERLYQADLTERRALGRRLTGEHDAEPDYSSIQRDRAKAFGAKNVEIPKELFDRQRPPLNVGVRNVPWPEESRSRSNTHDSYISVGKDNDNRDQSPLSNHAQHTNKPERTNGPHREHKAASPLSAVPEGAVASEKTERSYVTAPDALRAVPIGSQYPPGEVKAPPPSPVYNLGDRAGHGLSSGTSRYTKEDSSVASVRTGRTISGHYFHQRLLNRIKNIPKRRKERKHAKLLARQRRLDKTMHKKQQHLQAKQKEHQEKIDGERSKEQLKEQRRQQKLAKTRRKMRRMRERAWSSDEGRLQEGIYQGVAVRDFARAQNPPRSVDHAAIRTQEWIDNHH